MSGTISGQRPSKRQRESLNFIDNFISGHGYGPSYREIMRGLGYRSVATVALHIDNLIAKGYLVKRTYRARSLEVVKDKADDFQPVMAEASSEKWLVKRIDERFKAVERSPKPSARKVDELYVLTGALKVLGYDQATSAFISRLTDIKKQFKAK